MPLGKNIEDNFMAVPAMWGKAASDGTIHKLAGLMESQPMGLPHETDIVFVSAAAPCFCPDKAGRKFSRP